MIDNIFLIDIIKVIAIVIKIGYFSAQSNSNVIEKF